MTLQLSDLVGAYRTSTVGYGDAFSPLVINDDGSVVIAGTIVVATFGVVPGTLSIFNSRVNGVEISGLVTFEQIGGVMHLVGELQVGSTAGIGYGGEQLVPFSNPTLANSVDAFGAFDNGDALMITASNGQWVGYAANGTLQTSPQQPGFWFAVETTASGIKINYDGYKYWAAQLGGPVRGDATADQATIFNVRATLDGSAVLVAQGGGFVALAPDGTLVLANETALSLPMEFGFRVQPVAPEVLLARWGIASPQAALSPCELDIVSLCWQCTGGLFLALGLGPYMVTGEVKVGVMGILRSNAAVWQAVTTAAARLAANPNPALAWGIVTSVLVAAWKAGMLWRLVKYLLSYAGWWVLFKVVAKIIELVFIPELEVAELIASFVVWAGGLIQIAIRLSNDCAHTIAAGFQPAGLQPA